MGIAAPKKKIHNIDEILARMKEKAKNFKGKREHTDHDEILYGPSGSGKVRRKR